MLDPRFAEIRSAGTIVAKHSEGVSDDSQGVEDPWIAEPHHRKPEGVAEFSIGYMLAMRGGNFYPPPSKTTYSESHIKIGLQLSDEKKGSPILATPFESLNKKFPIQKN